MFLFNAALIASSNTFFKPSCVNAEHSTYDLAPNSFANPTPSDVCKTCPTFCVTSSSFLKSVFVPTNKNGASGT